MKRKTEKMQEILGSIISSKRWARYIARYGIFDHWRDEVGSEIADRAAPSRIHGTVLWINVSDSVWMQRLHLEKEKILAKLNSRLPDEARFTDLRFQLAPVGADETEVSASVKKFYHPLESSKDERQKKFFDAIADDQLREAMVRLWRKMP